MTKSDRASCCNERLLEFLTFDIVEFVGEKIETAVRADESTV